MYLLHKILPAFFSPIGIAILACLWALAFRSRRAAFLAALVLYVSAIPIVGDFALKRLENAAPPVALEDLPEAQIVLVLGGVINVTEDAAGRPISHLRDEGDRFEAGIAIWQAGKAETLMFTRGTTPWNTGPSEGDFLAARAEARGVPPSQIRLTERATTTEEEARAVARLGLVEEPIILVTSAYHMPRAARVLRYEGVKIAPYPVDFRYDQGAINVLSFVPNAAAFYNTSLGIREAIGRLYYRVKYPL